MDDKGQVPDDVTVDPSGTTSVEPETFDRAYVEKLRKENAALRVKHKERDERDAADEKRKLEEQGKWKELAEQRAKELAEERKARAGDLLEVYRERAGRKYGLPDELVARLRGDSLEDVMADAESLVPLIKGRKEPAPTLDANSLPAAKADANDWHKILTKEQVEFCKLTGEDPAEYAKWVQPNKRR